MTAKPTTAGEPAPAAVEGPVNSIFQRDWWLDAVAPGQWRMLEVRSADDEILARMPIVETRRYGARVLTMPKLTQFLGPWLAPSGPKSPRRLSNEKSRLYDLIDQLPPFDYFCQKWHPSLDNWMPFHWRNFQSAVGYTFIIPDLSDLDAVWGDFDGRTRNMVRKARKTVETRSDLGVDTLWRLTEKSFACHGRKPPWPRELVERLDAACAERGARRILAAEDAKGNIHAALFLVWDHLSAYYLIGGSDPDFRNSGAMSLLMADAIKHAAEVSATFDFEGSMVEPIEKFMRGFGGKLHPYIIVRGYSRRMRLVDGLRQAFRPASG